MRDHGAALARCVGSIWRATASLLAIFALAMLFRWLGWMGLTAMLVACGGDGESSKGDDGSGGAAGGGGSGGSAGAGDGGPPTLACRSTVWVEPPACGTGEQTWSGLVPGPNDSAFDAALAEKARKFDRQFHAINAWPSGVNQDLGVALDRTAEHAAIDSFINDSDSWDFEAHTGMKVSDAVSSFAKVAGLYAGNGIAADAYRYLTLRDSGGACADVDLAREHLVAGLDALHLATAITGVEGVIARGFVRTDLPGDGGFETTPLFDSNGDPLPEPKDNGTWREDQSGDYPNVIWEDSCSRDMIVGWAWAFAAAWEAIRLDPSFDDALKERLQADANALARSLMKVGEEGYDLEIRDADGRRTFHGILNENSIDRLYLPGAKNGFNAIMALGIVGSFAYVAEDPEIDAWLDDVLVAERRLHEMARDEIGLVDLGLQSNYSGYNMAFTGGFIAQRYLCSDEPRDAVREGIRTGLYERPGRERQPVEQKQTFYDYIYAAATVGGTAWADPSAPLDESAIARGTETLVDYWDPPFWQTARENCNDDEITSGTCVALDRSTIEVLGYVGRNDTLVAADPMPMTIRPGSNYYWRSNPYQVNGGGDGSRLIPAVDFRAAYWLGRWVRR